jgi:hypothetical protein
MATFMTAVSSASVSSSKFSSSGLFRVYYIGNVHTGITSLNPCHKSVRLILLLLLSPLYREGNRLMILFCRSFPLSSVAESEKLRVGKEVENVPVFSHFLNWS